MSFNKFSFYFSEESSNCNESSLNYPSTTPSNSVQPELMEAQPTSSSISSLEIDESQYISTAIETLDVSLRFQSAEEVKTYVFGWGKMSKEDLVIFKSDFNRIRFKCILGGKYRNRTNVNPSYHIRKSSTRLIDCPFRITSYLVKVGWKLVIANPLHNHLPGDHYSAYPTQQRLNTEAITIVSDLTKGGCNPRNIISTLRDKFPDQVLSARNIYNLRAKFRRVEQDGRSSMHLLYDTLQEAEEWIWKIHVDDNNHVNRLFLMNKEAKNLLQTHHNVLIGDCTYKTNKYNLPLLVIIGITATNSTYIVCLVFLNAEQTSDYVWALEKLQEQMAGKTPEVFVTDKDQAFTSALEISMPSTSHLLCVWHINQNILAKCKPLLGDKWNDFNLGWKDIIYASTEEMFRSKWDEFQLTWEQESVALEYIRRNWISIKTKWATAFTNKIQHFGSASTSRVEGTHAMIKRYIQVSNNDLKTDFYLLVKAVNNQYAQIKLMADSQKIRTPHQLRISFFQEVVNKISNYSAFKILEEYKIAQSYSGLMSQVCYCSITNIYGLPCRHKILSMLLSNQSLSLEDVDRQWWLHNIDETLFSNTEGNSISIQNEINIILQQFPSLHRSKQELVKQSLENIAKIGVPIIQEPVFTASRGRPSANTSTSDRNNNSTRRIPTAAERVEPPRRQYNCGICGVSGHTRTTCPQRNN